MKIVPTGEELNPPAIHGPVVPGEAVKTRKELEKVISLANSSMFDIADLLHKIKVNKFYDGNTFQDYLKTLNFKERRLRYLVTMAEVMEQVGIPRVVYEPLGLSKLRAITSLKPNDTWINPETKEEIPMSVFIQEFVEKGHELTGKEILDHVKLLKGEVGEEALGWLNIRAKQSVIDNVIKPAIEKARMLIGTVYVDEEGMAHDATDGQCLEAIGASFLSQELGNE